MRTFGENENISQKQNSWVRQKHFETHTHTHTGQISLFSSHQFIPSCPWPHSCSICPSVHWMKIGSDWNTENMSSLCGEKVHQQRPIRDNSADGLSAMMESNQLHMMLLPLAGICGIEKGWFRSLCCFSTEHDFCQEQVLRLSLSSLHKL